MPLNNNEFVKYMLDNMPELAEVECEEIVDMVMPQRMMENAMKKLWWSLLLSVYLCCNYYY